MKALWVTVILSFSSLAHAQDMPLHVDEIKMAIQKATMAPGGELNCQPTKLIKKKKQLQDIQVVHRNQCYDQYAERRVSGNVVAYGKAYCEFPIEFLMDCKTNRFRNIEVKRIEHSFANTESVAHIPPRGWTTSIVLDRYEEEVSDSPEPQLLKIKCFTAEKMADLSKINAILGGYIILE